MLNPQNRSVVDRYWSEFIGKKNLSCAGEVFAEGLVLYDPLSLAPVVGRERYVEMVGELFRAFPDIRYTAEEEIADGDKVVIRWTMRGTQAGAFVGIAATGKSVTMSGVDMLYLAQGRIEALRVEANLLGLVHQLGAAPHLDLVC